MPWASASIRSSTVRTCICRTLRHSYIQCNPHVPCPQPCMVFKHTGALFFISQAARVLRVTAASQPCVSSSRGGSSAERLSTVDCRLWTDDCGLWTGSAWAPLPSLSHVFVPAHVGPAHLFPTPCPPLALPCRAAVLGTALHALEQSHAAAGPNARRQR